MATAMRAATAFFSPSISSSPNPNQKQQPFFSARRGSAHHRLRALPATELTLEELNPSVDLLRKTAEAVGDFRKTPIYIVGTDCNAKRNIDKLLANSII